MARLKIAVVGLGKIAQDHHLPAIASSPSFELVATADPVAPSVPGLTHFKTCEDLLSHFRGELDAVVLATPPQVRFRLADLCLTGGVHVLLEKPPTTTLAELAGLSTKAAERSLTLFTAWHARFNPSIDSARRQLKENTRVRFRVTWHEDWQQWHSGQAWIWQAGGLGVFDAGINAFSILTLLSPRPLTVREAELTFPPGLLTPVKASLTLDDGAGWSGRVSLDWSKTSQLWDIVFEPDGGEQMVLRRGGADLLTEDNELRGEPMLEYPGIYERFAELIAQGTSDVDGEPLRIALEALKIGARNPIELE